MSMRGGDVSVKVGMKASTTVTSVDVDCPAALKAALRQVLDAERERVEVALKRDLAVNLLAP